MQSAHVYEHGLTDTRDWVVSLSLIRKNLHVTPPSASTDSLDFLGSQLLVMMLRHWGFSALHFLNLFC